MAQVQEDDKYPARAALNKRWGADGGCSADERRNYHQAVRAHGISKFTEI
jgi:hypothetical protein